MTLIVPNTQGIQYAGSKRKIIPYIVSLLDNLKDVRTVLDGFSGTTRVSQAFAQLGYDTTSNDVSVWSETFGRCYLLAQKPIKYYQEMIDELNNLKGFEGWFCQNYGGRESDTKKPFQLKNAMRLDAIREQIEKYNLSANDKSVLLTSLILALNKVDNTLGHYAAYLSKWSRRSYNDLKLVLPQKFEIKTKNTVVKGDVFDVIENKGYDLAYFDPPYGSNNEKMPSSRVRYNAYYHLWTSVVLNDKPKLFGKANRRIDSKDSASFSVFEDFRKSKDSKFIAMHALDRLIKNTKARYVMLSYSSGGRATKQELLDILNTNGALKEMLEIDYKKNVMSKMRWTNKWINTDSAHKEYLFLLKK